MQTYYFILASQGFLAGEALDEVLKERTRYYQEQEKEIDFWLVHQPAFGSSRDGGSQNPMSSAFHGSHFNQSSVY